MLSVRDHILYIIKVSVIYVIFICAVKRTYFLQSEMLVTPRGDVACDVMSRLSDQHLKKLATYDLHS